MNYRCLIEFINKQALLDAEFALEQQHQARRLDLVLGTGSKIQEMTKAFNKSNLQGAIAFFAADFGGFSQHSRKMFELQKAAKLANAAITLPSTVIRIIPYLPVIKNYLTARNRTNTYPPPTYVKRKK